jgi:hypothetical protein
MPQSSIFVVSPVEEVRRWRVARGSGAVGSKLHTQVGSVDRRVADIPSNAAKSSESDESLRACSWRTRRIDRTFADDSTDILLDNACCQTHSGITANARQHAPLTCCR